MLSQGSSRAAEKSVSVEPARASSVQAPQGDSEEVSGDSPGGGVGRGVAPSAGADHRTAAEADLGNAIEADDARPTEGGRPQDAADGMGVEGTEPLDRDPLVGFDQVGAEGQGRGPRVPKESLMQDFARCVTEQVGFLRTAGTRSWTVQVEPNSLGAVRLEISLREHGVTADITTSHPIIRELLDHHQGQLRQALADHGFSVDRFSVNVGDPEQRSSGRSWEQAGQSRPWGDTPEHRPAIRSTSANPLLRHASESGALNVVNVYI